MLNAKGIVALAVITTTAVTSMSLLAVPFQGDATVKVKKPLIFHRV
jgi:hypothetical protein